MLDRSGKEIRFVETDRYMPAHVCFDAKHALWTFGWQRDIARNGAEDSQDYFLFRKYSVDGKQLGAYALRSLFPKPGLEPGAPSGGLWRLRISDDRTGAIAYSGQTSGNPEWIEVGLDGGLIGRWKLGPPSRRSHMCSKTIAHARYGRHCSANFSIAARFGGDGSS